MSASLCARNCWRAAFETASRIFCQNGAVSFDKLLHAGDAGAARAPMSTAMASGPVTVPGVGTRGVPTPGAGVSRVATRPGAPRAIGVVRASPFRNLSSCRARPRTASPSLERIAPPDPFRFPVNASHRRHSTTCASHGDPVVPRRGRAVRRQRRQRARGAAVVQGAHAEVERGGAPAGEAGGDAPPVPDVERRQSHAAYWLTTVYETQAAGRARLEQARLDFIRRVENAVTSVPDFENFCRRAPTRARVRRRPARGSRWVPPARKRRARRRSAPRQ